MENALLAQDALRTETGFVGFFDILGYKYFLESGIRDVTFKVIRILDTLPNSIDAEHEKFVGTCYHENYLKRDLDQVRFRVVSDSILLAYAYDESREKPSQAATFLVTANLLARCMFDEGLPVRGAIAFGDFVLGKHAFAGKPIIDSYTLGQSLDLAACAAHKTAEREFEALVSADPNWKDILDDNELPRVRYRAPINHGSEELELSCLNLTWPPLDGHPPLENLPDLRDYVYEQCMACGKQIGLDAIPKVENTERFLRFLQIHHRKLRYGNR